jgi:hypothetical protein
VSSSCLSARVGAPLNAACVTPPPPHPAAPSPHWRRSEVYVPYCGLAVLEQLSGLRTPVHDPFVADVGSPEWQAVQPHQERAIAAAAEVLKIALLPPAAPGGGGAGAATA